MSQSFKQLQAHVEEGLARVGQLIEESDPDDAEKLISDLRAFKAESKNKFKALDDYWKGNNRRLTTEELEFTEMIVDFI